MAHPRLLDVERGALFTSTTRLKEEQTSILHDEPLCVFTNPEHDLLVVDGRRLTEPHGELGLVALNVLRHSHLVFLQLHATLYEGITFKFNANMYENVVVVISRNA